MAQRTALGEVHATSFSVGHGQHIVPVALGPPLRLRMSLRSWSENLTRRAHVMACPDMRTASGKACASVKLTPHLSSVGRLAPPAPMGAALRAVAEVMLTEARIVRWVLSCVAKAYCRSREVTDGRRRRQAHPRDRRSQTISMRCAIATRIPRREPL